MTKNELINKLQQLDGNPIIILQKDAEGNGYSPAAGVENGWYAADSTYSGEVYHDDGSAQQKSIPCIILWPIN